MTTYTITAKKEFLYTFKIKATDEKDALNKLEYLELNGDISKFATDESMLELLEIN